MSFASPVLLHTTDRRALGKQMHSGLVVMLGFRHLHAKGQCLAPMWRALVLLCLCALPVPEIAAQTPVSTPAPLLMPESRLPAKLSVPVFGQNIVFYDAGTGPVVVLVHGFGSEARFDWGNVILPLAEHHRVIALDQIGFGGSDKPFVDYSIQTYVDFLGEFLRTLNVHEFTLAGESLGGWISALYTIESLAPENAGPRALPKPRRLILEDAAGMSPLPSASPIAIAGTLADAHGVAIVFHDKSRVTEEFVREAWAMKLKSNDGFTQRSLRGNAKTAEEVVSGRLAKITIPTLVVWGGSDEIVPLAQGHAYAEGIPGARLTIIPECGHGPSIEKPAEFLAMVLPFID
jgi:pimeloyl-ACP methyl ester carboxylesterase